MSRRHSPAESQTHRPVAAQAVHLAAEPMEGEQEIPHEKIEARAYEIWVERGRPQGTHLEDWYQAEVELAAEYAPKVRPVSNPQAARR